jgi:hypothetical protein
MIIVLIAAAITAVVTFLTARIWARTGKSEFAGTCYVTTTERMSSNV